MLKYVGLKIVRGARNRRNLSGRGRGFSSSHSPNDNLDMPLLFGVTLFGGSILYAITDIVKYNIHNRRLVKIRKESKYLDDLCAEKFERYKKKRDEVSEKFEKRKESSVYE